MWDHLEPEIEALRQSCFGANYAQFPDVAQSFLRIVSYVIAQQHEDSWGRDEFEELLTAHMVRLLHQMGISLSDRWNLKRYPATDGNLLRATSKLVQAYHTPDDQRPAHWGRDIWDDCYILLAICEVKDELKQLDPKLCGTFEDRYKKSLVWLKKQAQQGFKTLAKGRWYGPGFHAGAAELLHDRAPELLPALAGHVDTLLRAPRGADWEKLFAWHIGQLIVIQRKLRGTSDAWRQLDDVLGQYYLELKSAKRQSDSGAWDNEGKISYDMDVLYCTVRGLAACYVMEDAPATCDTIRKAHTYLLSAAREDPPLRNTKACVNAIECYQQLFHAKIPSVHLNLLFSLMDRLDSLGLSASVLQSQDERQTLADVRCAAQRRLAGLGGAAIEPLGINDQLYDELIGHPEVLQEFQSVGTETRDALYAFLSAPMTEVRSNRARGLIRDLWNHTGFLNFMPFLERLSDLEHD